MKDDFKDKRPKGRPPKRWSDQIRGHTKIPLATAEKFAKDRGKWRRLVNEKWAKPHAGCAVKESK